MNPNNLFFLANRFSLYYSEYSNKSKSTRKISFAYCFISPCSYKLFKSFKIITRICKSFYFNYVIFPICLLFSS